MTPGAADGPEDPGDLLRETEDPASGALVVLRGDVPVPDRADDPELEAIEQEALRRFEVRACRLRVRRGDAPDGASVTAVVRAPHRRDAFEAARWSVAEARRRLAETR